ncbi:MAG TPA: HRDC domain-containing protein [Phaeodactylibacter sp.]|nr:HRDC domain-containing protein [Phaeodactylibacter sp.]
MKNELMEDYTLIETPDALDQFYEEHKNLDWLGFDTEFVGEKRYTTRLCLIQTISDKGLYLIDPIRLQERLGPFLRLIEDARIEKITHAGDNDYRLLYNLYGILPRNVFDTQVVGGFVGYKYPTSFRKLVEGELGKRLKKGYAVADWEARPLKNKPIKYALDDVIPLPGLWRSLKEKLKEREREHWADEELQRLEQEAFYYKDPHHDALNSNLMRNLNTKEKAFLLRLYAWRDQLAKKRDHSKEMVLASKYIGHIVRGIPSGANALQQNRRIPNKLAQKYGKEFESLYKKDISPEEQEILARVPSEADISPKEQVLMELLYHVIKYRCLEEDISINMVVPRNLLKTIRSGEETAKEAVGDGWRKEMLGKYFIDWLATAKDMNVQLADDKIVLIPH